MMNPTSSFFDLRVVAGGDQVGAVENHSWRIADASSCLALIFNDEEKKT